MPDKIEIIKTKDGSCTLYLKELDETYHSVNGAFSESLHVFIKNGLKKVAPTILDLNILEIGLGTGLNALLTMENIGLGQHINYYALEPFPLTSEMIHGYYAAFDRQPLHLDKIDLLMNGEYNQVQTINEQFKFCLLHKRLQVLEAMDVNETKFDIVYYDAFAPGKQADMWEEQTIKKAVGFLKPGGFLVSYCAQGQFKRNLKSLGLNVEALPGPLGKREMTIAYKSLEA